MPRYATNSHFEPTAENNRLTVVAEMYTESERFDEDAWQWSFDHPDPADRAIARQRYADSPQFADVVADIADGEVVL